MTKDHAPLELSGTCSPTGWEPPADLPEAEWRRFGVALSKLERGLGWLVGDWWIYGNQHYGRRKAMTEAEDWEGPSFQSCCNAASVCRRFEGYRRRELLSFSHHAAVASLPMRRVDELLDWCMETTPPRSVRELREKLGEHRVEYTSHTVEVAPRKVVYISTSDASSAPKFPRVPEAPRAADPPASPPATREIAHVMTLALAPDVYARLRRYADVVQLSTDEALERLVEEALQRNEMLVTGSNINDGPRH
jgi:hypothetical protein